MRPAENSSLLRYARLLTGVKIENLHLQSGLPIVSQHTNGCGIALQNGPVFSPHREIGHRRIFIERPISLLGVAEALFGALLLRDEDHQEDHNGHLEKDECDPPDYG